MMCDLCTHCVCVVGLIEVGVWSAGPGLMTDMTSALTNLLVSRHSDCQRGYHARLLVYQSKELLYMYARLAQTSDERTVLH